MSDRPHNILLCVTGGIAAYKAIDLLSLLKKAGFGVKTIMTKGACEFVSPLSFRAIPARKSILICSILRIPFPISIWQWADLIVVAPATANVLAKAAHGLSDDLLSSTLLAARCPVLFVPAMNVFMYENQATQDNLALLKARGIQILEPATGLLACGYEGKGKYPPQ